MTETEKAIRDFCGHHADWWPSTTQVQAMLALAQPAVAEQHEQEPVAWISHNAGLYHGKPDESLNPLPLYLTPPPCPTCEALARTVMLDQTSHDQFKPDWDTQAVLVEEMQRMAKRIEDLEAMLERQTARIVDLQTHIENFEGEDQ